MYTRAKKSAFLFIILLAIATLTMATAFFASSVLGKTAFADSSVYEIRTDEDLVYLQTLSGDNENFGGKTVELYANVNAPEGGIFNSFAGKFNGNGFVIKGLNGTFANTITSAGEVRDVTFTDVNCPSSSKGALAVFHSGLLTNVSLYGSSSSSVVYYNKGGRINKVYSYLEITGETTFVYRNGTDGEMEACFVRSDLTVPAGKYQAGLLVYENESGSMVMDSGFQGKISAAENVTIYPFGEELSSTVSVDGAYALYSVDADAEGEITPSYDGLITGSFVKNVIDNKTRVFAGTGIYVDYTSDEDFSVLSDLFYLNAEAYPVNKALFGKEGSSSEKIALEDMNDVNKLNFLSSSAEFEGFYAELGADIVGDRIGSALVQPIDGVMKINVIANGHIFAKSEDPFYGFQHINAAVPIESGFGGDGYQAGGFTAVTPEECEGEGTQASPYKVRTAGELADLLSDGTKNVAGKYAVILKDVIINNSLSGNNVLGLSAFDVNLCLDGLDSTLANFCFSPFASINGTLKNLTLVLSAHEDLNHGLCERVQGTLAYADVYNVTEVTVTTGLAAENAGSIVRCFNGIEGTEYAFSAANTGTITESSSVASDNFADRIAGITLSVKEGYYVADGTIREGSDHDTLSVAGYVEEDDEWEYRFDVENVFGYEVGGSEDYPVIRKHGGKYRVKGLRVTDPNSIGYGGLRYSPEGYDVTDLRDDICDESTDVTLRWEYEGEDYYETALINAGEYKLYVTASKEGYFTERKTFTINVQKANFAPSLTFDSFGNISVYYTGENIIVRPVPTNLTEEFTVSYKETVYGSNAVTNVRNCGRYSQTVIATADNYNTLTAVRTITVLRSVLTVTVTDSEVTYGESADFSGAGNGSASATGALGADEGKTLKTLVEEAGLNYPSYFTTNYTAGNDVGAYEINYTLSQLPNYTLTVIKGTLQVIPADITGYSFANREFTYDGIKKNVIISGIPSSANVSYLYNGETGEPVNAGTYIVTATVTDGNYNTLVAEATLKINKKTIVMQVSDKTAEYGYVFNGSDFNFTAQNLSIGENFVLISEGVTFIYYVEGEDGSPLRVGVYPVKLRTEGESLNHDFRGTDGLLTINKASFKSLYPASSYGNVTVEYTGEVCSVELPADAFGDEEVSVSYSITDLSDYFEEISEVGQYYVSATVTPVADTETAHNFLATTYTKSVRITLIKPVITFDEEIFTFTYDGSNFVSREFGYTAEKIPDGGEITLTFFTRSGEETNEIIHAGRYTVAADFVGNGNYADASARAVLIVEARVAFLTVSRTEYAYSGGRLTPEASLSFEGDFNGTLTLADVKYLYTSGVDVYEGIAEAGTYSVTATSRNSDYAIKGEDGEDFSCEIIITPYVYDLVMPDLSFEYGSSGENVSGDVTFVIGDNYLTVKNHYVSGTGKYIDVRFRLQAEDVTYSGGICFYKVDDYVINESLVYNQKNYTFRLSAPFTVSVTRRTLTAKWFIEDSEIDGYTFSVTYAGVNQASRFTCVLTNFAPGEDETFLQKDVASTEIRNVGEYTLSVSISKTAHYNLDRQTDDLRVIVKKANLLAVVINDGTVMQYENIRATTYAEGLLGEDVGKPTNRLSGYSFAMITNYNASSALIGERYKVSGSFTFNNYIVNAVESGYYEVVQGYKNYSLADVSFVYDGTDKRVVIEGLEDGVTVRYTNNVQRNAGTYTVTATVVYPTSRTTTISCKLNITKATPAVVCPTEYKAYDGDYSLTAEGVNAVAMLGETPVSGTFSFASTSANVTRGTNVINITFIPDDTTNFKNANFTKTIVCYEISNGNFVYNNYNFGILPDGTINLKEPLEIVLDKSGFPEIASDVEFCQNDIVVGRAVLNKTGKERLSIRYKEKTIYETELNVVYNEQKQDDKQDGGLVVDHNMFEVEGLSFAEDGSVVYIEGGNATIKLDQKYKEDFVLYVNDVPVSGSYTIDPSDKNLLIIIVYKKTGVSVYAKRVDISTDANPEKSEISQDKKDSFEFKTYYYYIIAGVAAAAIAAVVVIIIIRRK